jgi:hypothetical protein
MYMTDILSFNLTSHSLGGNSVKASSGINGAGTTAQRELDIPDTPDALCALNPSPSHLRAHKP